MTCDECLRYNGHAPGCPYDEPPPQYTARELDKIAKWNAEREELWKRNNKESR